MCVCEPLLEPQVLAAQLMPNYLLRHCLRYLTTESIAKWSALEALVPGGANVNKYLIKIAKKYIHIPITTTTTTPREASNIKQTEIVEKSICLKAPKNMIAPITQRLKNSLDLIGEDKYTIF